MNNPINTPAAQLVKGGLVKSGNFYGEVADISGDIVTIESGNDETLTAKIDDCETISPNEYLNYLFTPRK